MTSPTSSLNAVPLLSLLKINSYLILPPLHDYQFDEELSIAAYYTNNKEDGYAAASNLLIKRNVPWSVKHQTYKNVLCYVQPLKCSRFSPINFEFPLIQENGKERSVL